MGDFVVFHAAAFAHVHPAAQPVEAEAIAAVLAIHVHQLHRGAIAAHAGVQRRGVDGREDGVDAVAHGAAHEVLGDAPVFLREDLHAGEVARQSEWNHLV